MTMAHDDNDNHKLTVGQLAEKGESHWPTEHFFNESRQRVVASIIGVTHPSHAAENSARENHCKINIGAHLSN